ncbi:hypothetical protein [Xenorhabdus bovienii]|uniref:hypothetical protein n=1 Tax=Xenorhabdus bovienii TaxID=40576 RepID=UPI0023B330F4|nr:hypothetical protein [Xenorhabdus bovienii]MDE9544156.1 hypothetical protein [Xenorhabdus bovienii]
MNIDNTCKKEILKKMKDISIIVEKVNSLEHFTPFNTTKVKILSFFYLFLYLLILIVGGYFLFLFLFVDVPDDQIFNANADFVVNFITVIFPMLLWFSFFTVLSHHVFDCFMSPINKKRETIAIKKRNIYMETDDYHLFLEKKCNEIDELLITYKPNNYNNFKKLQKNIKSNGFKFEFILEFIHEEENSQDQEKLKETFKFLSKTQKEGKK